MRKGRAFIGCALVAGAAAGAWHEGDLNIKPAQRADGSWRGPEMIDASWSDKSVVSPFLDQLGQQPANQDASNPSTTVDTSISEAPQVGSLEPEALEGLLTELRSHDGLFCPEDSAHQTFIDGPNSFVCFNPGDILADTDNASLTFKGTLNPAAGLGEDYDLANALDQDAELCQATLAAASEYILWLFTQTNTNPALGEVAIAIDLGSECDGVEATRQETGPITE